ncbi:hypothetical protein [Thalassobacillus pellis]|uniref:hypothetical protein n=1 Tax=Thalassobacillus pellis TaxID=748008 RepID=UPI00195FB8BB|nr:hypothetical protein [Thalassobacillus pellis]MBM7554560.1 hypothetical protein [Thalassobacillus pellis]
MELFETDRAAIRSDLGQAVKLEVGTYIRYLNDYGNRLRNRAAHYEHPEIAFPYLLAYAEEVRKELTGDDSQ